MNNLDLNVKNKYGLEESKAEQIETVFAPMVSMLKGFEKSYNDIVKEADVEITSDVSMKARELRLSIKKIRVNADKIHKELKAEALRYGKAVDGVRNILKYAVVEKEEKLAEIEKFEEIKRQKEIAELQEKRLVELSKYTDVQENLDLGSMETTAWDMLLSGAKSKYEAEQKAIKEEEEKRIAREKKEKEEKERIKKENAKLKAEQEKIRKELEEEKRKAKEEAEKRRKENEAKEKEEQARLKGSDKDKMKRAFDDIVKLGLSLPEMESEEFRKLREDVLNRLRETARIIKAYIA